MKKVLLLSAVVALAAMPSMADAKSHKKKAPPPKAAAAEKYDVPVLGPILDGFIKLPRMAINDMRKY
jgi:hypothetical protein